MCSRLADFRDESKLASKLFSTIALVVGKLMASAKMQIAGVIKDILVAKVIIDEEIVKDSEIVVVVLVVVIVVVVLVVIVVVVVVIVVLIVLVVMVVLIVMIVVIKVAVVVIVVIVAVNEVVNHLVLKKCITAVYIKKNLFHTFFLSTNNLYITIQLSKI